RFERLGRLLKGVALLGECTPRTLDGVLATGEALSASLLAAALRQRGLPAVAVDPGRWIVTDEAFGEARVDAAATATAARREAAAVEGVPVVPGFTGATAAGDVTTLGRGGSDHSAAVLGVSLSADRVEIWTDVDGVMTADPRVVDDATRLDTMSFDELLELTHWGAKVVHPGAARLLRERGLPLVIRNALRPGQPGTEVSTGGGSGGEDPVRALASRADTALMQLAAPGGDDGTDMAMRALTALRDGGIRVVMVTQGSSEASVCVVVPDASTPSARAALEDEFRLERETRRIDAVRVERACAVVTVVGDGMRRRTGISARVFGVLGHHGINVRAIAQGASERTISVVVSGADGAAAVRAVHDAFFAPRPRAAELWVAGTGRVGSALLDQLAGRAAHHRLRVTGIGTSRGSLLSREGVDLEGWRQALSRSDASADALVEAAIASPHHPRVFVDCTASPTLPSGYERLLAAGVSVVAANKIGFSGPVEAWRRLQAAAREGAAVYHETTVGAGLPILRTVADLVHTGDRIVRLQGVLSGTLGYLCDELMGGRTFSEAVRSAHELGYTEPDPRDDLSGTDVARKLVILARAAGLELEPSDVDVEPLLPREAVGGTLEAFWERLPSLDDFMARSRADADASGGRLVYMGTVEDGRARVGLEVVPREHPCWSLRGSENLVLVVSDRYSATPLVVRGPGAGPEVTAAGVFADVLRARAEAQEAPVRLRAGGPRGREGSSAEGPALFAPAAASAGEPFR
ncbi:MAG: bifunctional aspartate kinase/homoserine dehydrogenase I, partial [Gemmatimonadetes bacterium]|nr:bifunctional aspartate kinase/homoserine dehydrogenase I [Gemmatimonadota bacterium]